MSTAPQPQQVATTLAARFAQYIPGQQVTVTVEMQDGSIQAKTFPDLVYANAWIATQPTALLL